MNVPTDVNSNPNKFYTIVFKKDADSDGTLSLLDDN